MLNSPEEVVEFYRKAFEEEGATPRGMRWADSDTHWKRLTRLRYLIAALDVPKSRVLDVGCGIGMLYKVWDMRFTGGTYHGVDVVPEYVDEAGKLMATDPDAVAVCEDFLKWWSVDPFSVTVAVGAFAWQPKEIVDEMINRMWEQTQPNGAMAFTFIPDMPLSLWDVRRLGVYLPDVDESVIATGYSQTMGEHIAVFKKAGQTSNPYKHVEEIAQEVLMGEYREEAEI